MILIVTGLIFTLIGLGNLAVGRLHADRPNARLSRNLGFVGIACGVLTFLAGVAQVAGILPDSPPPIQPGIPRNLPEGVKP